MKARIQNIFSDKILPNSGLKSGWGLSLHIKIGEEEVLMDLGCTGEDLPYNLQMLDIKIDDISKVVLSHAHIDHTGGLNAFLKTRTKPIPIIAHPLSFEEKASKRTSHQGSIGVPEIPKDLAEKIQLQLSTNQMQVLPNLYTTGEIPLSDRVEIQEVDNLLHKVDGSYCWDPVLDDLSLVLNTKDGLVLITGCCHAGILNVCKKATMLFRKKISAIIGGVHMVEYSERDIDHVEAVLREVYELPQLYLCHCTGVKTIYRLKEKLGAKCVHDFFAGMEVSFEI
jgi:7,8-dihydropterin-6-yl-methyl-4-(beta-D-ribofuranosyl)aminobenzene 5'-phosphate synthase